MAEKLMKYADAVKKFDPVIGLETHVELSTTTKLFCPAEVSFGGDPNSQLTPVSLGLPGSLPVVNKTAVDYAIKLGLALHCEIAEWSQFARKNYFYRICRAITRSRSTTSRPTATAILMWNLKTALCSACRSNAPTSKTTLVRTPTSVVLTAVSKAPITLWSTTTVQVCR